MFGRVSADSSIWQDPAMKTEIRIIKKYLMIK